MSAYQQLENHILNLFNNCNELIWNNHKYTKIQAYKPRPIPSGECKTDVYVSLIENNSEVDCIKISIKNDNAEFLANKLTENDAESLLGSSWKDILIDSMSPIEDEFRNKTLVALKPKKSPTELFITLGWKLEITNKPRTLSSELRLTTPEIIDYIYRGTNQPDYRKNARVNNQITINSGVADYILEGNIGMFSTANDVINSIKLLAPGYFMPPPTYLAFTANNYRLIADTADGPRTLSVAIRWELINQKLCPNFIFNQPLLHAGQTDMMPYVIGCLNQLNINPTTYNKNNIQNLKISDIY